MKPTLIALALGSLAVVAIWFYAVITPAVSSNVVVPSAIAGSCVDRYDYLLTRAKAALIRGDRIASAEMLAQAEKIIPGCPALQNGDPQQTALLDLSNRDGAPRD